MSRLSIRTKLPLAIGAVILIVGVSIALAAWIVIHRASYERAEARLTSLGQMVSSLLGTQATNAQNRAARVARRPEIAGFLNGTGGVTEDAVREVLRSSVAVPPAVKYELRDQSGQVRIAAAPGAAGDALQMSPADWQTVIRPLDDDEGPGPGRDAMHGRLRTAGRELFYPVVARVPGQAGGYFVEWRRLTVSPQVRGWIAQFVGADAGLLIGNEDGSVWSDFGSPLDESLPALTPDRINYLTRPGRGEVAAAATAVPGTPWHVAADLSRHDVEAPVRRFLGTVGGIAAVTTGLGVLLGWMLGRRITAPVQSLTAAADAIAAGDVSHRVAPRGDDEFARLARSFNSMADEVQRSQDTLEDQVAQRTRELREARESLARREKLTLIAHLAGGVGHEIRNPLGVMSNAIYYLEAVQKDAPKDVRDYLALLRQQVNVTAKIVNDLLDMSRTTPAHRQVMHVKDLVEPRLERLKGTVIERDLPADLPAIDVDPVHAGQVLDNLLENAVQAMGGSGTIRVQARDTRQGSVQIEIADTGPGIRPEHVSKIFEPLFTTKARGIGLGLAVSKSLAQANGGDLALVSAPGQGARFAFTVPVAGSTT
jgi:signal transduction histidine kinase